MKGWMKSFVGEVGWMKCFVRERVDEIFCGGGGVNVELCGRG